MADRTRAAGGNVRLHVVTGKGGTGKSTVAAALALALAAGGKKVLLCEVEGRQGIAQMFDVAPLPYEERRVAVAPDGGDVYALAIDPEAALLEYLEMYYRLGRAGRALDRFGVIDFATTIAPGLRDVLLTGKVFEAVRRRASKGSQRPAYDAVVLDAPPTGRITRFLNVNAAMAGLARVGPIRNQADAIMTLLRSRRTAVHLVTVLEEMPVQETQDAIDELTAAELPVGSVVVNFVRRSGLSGRALDLAESGDLPAKGLRDGLVDAGIKPTEALVGALQQTAAEQAQRLQLEATQRRLVEKMDRPVVELPLDPDGIDLGSLYELAQEIQDQGLA
ncbi:MAG: P-loop NTPase [Actinomycetota bacterium]|nr:P-loop NTPase [Actinomycetota bacterium]